MERVRQGTLVTVLSGPSGVGKDAVLSRIKEREGSLHCLVTLTTRPQRAGERDGADYCFLSETEFHQKAKQGELLEQAKVYGNWYGVPRQPIKEALAKEQDVIMKVDVQGAATIRSLLPQAVLIFLVPHSLEELSQRLQQRKTESAFDLKLRREKAKEEMSHLPSFDYVLVNRPNKLELVVAQIKAIITAEKCRVKPRLVEWQQIA